MKNRLLALTLWLLAFGSIADSQLPLDPVAKKIAQQIEWITIPAGTFIMGSTQTEIESAYEDARLRSSLLDRHTFTAETPQRRIFLSEFQISKHEISNAQYRSFIKAIDRPKPRGFHSEDTWNDPKLNDPDQPVVGVTWFDAIAFAEWIGGTLPTEAQWERAARGTDGRKYPWGDEPPTRHHANFAKRFNKPIAIGQFSNGSSAEKIADLAGNVWEWCLDEYDPNFYKKSDHRDPLNYTYRTVKRDRVMRGGSWDYGRVFLRSALRFKFHPLYSTNNIGFRVVRNRDR